ncbi:MAG: hypothetical protein ABI831_13565 [Betaproteobacteria bacterium]
MAIQGPDHFPDAVPATLDDTWLDALLRQDAAATAYIDDAGFTAGVVAGLPEATPASRYRWIVPAMGLLGCFIGLVWFSGGESLSSRVVDLAQMKSLTLPNILAASLPLGLLYWLAVSAAWQER